MLWDGSKLGCFSSEVIEQEFKEKQRKYWQLRLEETFYALVIEKNKKYGLFPILSDELKPLFGLRKLGSHQIQIGKKEYFLFRVEFDHDTLYWDVTLTEYKEKIEDRKMIAKIFIFHDLLAITNANQSSIILRKEAGELAAYSYVLKNSHFFKDSVSLPYKVSNKWLEEYDHGELLQEMIGDNLAELGFEIEKVIRRIDRDFVWLSSSILDRIMKRIE